MESERPLVTASIIGGVVSDLLYQSDFEWPHYPEWVDLAVIGTGLGVLRSGFAFVKKGGLHWDSTQWSAVPRPFLNIPSLAYANALAAWTRQDASPSWSRELNTEIRRPVKASIKYLFKTGDSFFPLDSHAPSTGNPSQVNSPSQDDWWSRAAKAEPSSRVIALGQLQREGDISAPQRSTLVEALQSNNRSVVLHGIATVERMSVEGDAIAVELRSLVNDRDDEIRAKSLCTLTTLGMLDDATVQLTDEMLESHFRHNVFAGVYALSTLDSIPEFLLPSVQSAFMRALKSCDYEFVGLFAAAYNRWFDDPKAQVEAFLYDSPELLPIAVDAIERPGQDAVGQEVVTIG